MKKYPKKLKFAVIVISLIFGLGAYFAADTYNESQLTPWQKAQKTDFYAQTGATKFKAHIDAAIVGGLTFCASAIALVVSYKILRKR